MIPSSMRPVAGEKAVSEGILLVPPGDIEAAEDIRHVLREAAPALRLQDGGHAVEGLRDAPGNAGQGVAVAA